MNEKRNTVKSGADFQRDKENGFRDKSTNTSMHRNIADEKLKLECLKIAAEGLSRIEIPNVIDHGEKIISLSKQLENYVKGGDA